MRKHRIICAMIAVLTVAALILGSCFADGTTTAKKRNNRKNARPTAAVTDAPRETETPETTDAEVPEATREPGPITEPQEIADYIFEHGELPDNFITKKEAQELGWDSRFNYVSDVAPGKSIGGDYFGNYEGKLPRVKGRKYYEADCHYTGGRRNAFRIIYSNDGHVWYTEDHYNTFTELSPTKP